MDPLAAELEFLPEIPIDKSHTLDQLTSRFQSVEDGLPELVKNAKDQYSRLHVTDVEERQIVVIASAGRRSLAVLDFAGARREDFDGWQTWSSRTANQAHTAVDIEGGHGNGGKSFMVRGSLRSAFMESCAEGHRTKMGFRNDEIARRYLPAYYKQDGQVIRDIPDNRAMPRLLADLGRMGLSFEFLPAPAQTAFEQRGAFTIVHVDGIREWDGRRKSTIKRAIEELPELLRNHPQVALALETCAVWVMDERRVITQDPLAPSYPEPQPEFAEPIRIGVPDQLEDPDTGELIGTGDGAAEVKYLELRTSRDNLRIGKRKALNVVRVRNVRNVVANWSVADLCLTTTAAYIFGTLWVPALDDEHLAGADRQSLAQTPLVRALRDWAEIQIHDLAVRLQQSMSRRERPEDREVANATLNRLRELMRDYLDPDARQPNPVAGGQGEGFNRSTPGRPRGTNVDRIVFEAGHDGICIAVGTTVPLKWTAYELSADGLLPVLTTDIELVSEGRIADLQSPHELVGIAPGRSVAWLRHIPSAVESDPIEIEAIEAVGLSLLPPGRILKQGERAQVRALFKAADDSVRDDLFLESYVDEPDMGKLSRTGIFTAGAFEGQATVRVRWGADHAQTATAMVPVGNERVEPKDAGGDAPDIPVILLCGDEAPGTEDYPPDQRTHAGGQDYPTIIDFEPLWESVIWINPNSKESFKVRAGRGGSSGIAGIATKTFQQFLALKAFEILKRLIVRHEIADGAVTSTEFFLSFASAEMTCAGFLDSAYGMVEELAARMGADAPYQ